MILVAAGGMLLAGVGLGALKFGWISSSGASSAQKPEAAAVEKSEVGAMVKLSPLIINLKDEGGRSYLKTTIVLEILRKEAVEEVNKRMPVLTDAIIFILSEKRPQDLKGPEPMGNLKQEILTRLNQHLGPTTIKRVYFDEFLYQ
jgi:flagellar protein FliL